jgi:hypothetical protein
LLRITVHTGKLAIRYVFGVSSQASDADNLLKPTTDEFCERYGFDDRGIYRWEAAKEIVPKGQEYVEFEISSFDPVS